MTFAVLRHLLDIAVQAASAAEQQAEARRLAELQLLMMDEGQLRHAAGTAAAAEQGKLLKHVAHQTAAIPLPRSTLQCRYVDTSAACPCISTPGTLYR
jgi:hypothetical protein